MQPVIRVDKLSKRYQLGLTHAGSVRELINGAVARLRGRGNGRAKAAGADHVWALHDVSFEVRPGEVLGIIGRNGAGKSTLLKILSRITTPTAGRVEMRGRVASLLEVGTGFHPELTGRENVYMNGTVLGMTRREIDRAFDSIVDFAGVETFIDTPVKRYSSGMTVRLGFAVAAHMSPEILIIDEVLAVGDAEFQKRCIGKMDDVAKSGRTVLFVSHNMASIRQLAPRSVLIEGGRVVIDSDTETVLNRYLGNSSQLSSGVESFTRLQRLPWAGDQSVAFSAGKFSQKALDDMNKPVNIEIGLRAQMPAGRMRIGATLYQSDGTPVGSAFSDPLSAMHADEERFVRLALEIGDLAPGRYWFRLGLLNPRNQLTDLVDEVLHFEVPQNRNVPQEFIQWDRGWGPIRIRLKSSCQTGEESVARVSDSVKRS